MGKILNFDNFMAEKKKETISVTVMGKEYVVPMEIPAIVPVMMARAENANDATANTRMVMRAADAMFGEANVNQMCADGLSAANLAMLVQQLHALGPIQIGDIHHVSVVVLGLPRLAERPYIDLNQFFKG